MMFTVNKKDLSKAVARCASITDKKNDSRAAVYMKIRQKDMFLSAADIDHYICDLIPIESEYDGEICLNVFTLHEIIKRCKGEIRIEKHDTYVSLLSEKSIFDLPIIEYNFDPFPEEEASITIRLTRNAIEAVHFAMLNDESRYTLNGMCIKQYEDHVILITTDGHRLASYELEDALVGKISEDGIILSKKTINEIMKMMNEYGPSIDIKVGDKYVFITIATVVFAARLIAGQFPNCNGIINASYTYSFVSNKIDMIEAIDRVSVITDEKIKQIMLQSENNILHIQASHYSNGRAKDSIDIVWDDKNTDAWNANFNAKYLLESIKHCKSDDVRISFKDDVSAIKISSPIEDNYLSAVMPMRA